MISRPARFFDTTEEYRQWLEEHHANETVLWIGYYTVLWIGYYKEAVDQSLCFGWIDGVAQGIDDATYCQRFTPRRPRSIWSVVNMKRVEQLIAEGQMHPAGLAAYNARTPERSGIYSHEQAEHALSPEFEQRFREHEAAWAFFDAQPASYRKTAIWLVNSAKREATRVRRLETLIETSAGGQRLPQLTSPGRRPRAVQDDS